MHFLHQAPLLLIVRDISQNKNYNSLLQLISKYRITWICIL